MIEKIQLLKHLREEQETMKAKKKVIESALKESHKEFYAKLEDNKSLIETTEAMIKKEATEGWNEGDSKDVGYGVKITEGVQLVYDEPKALEWAKTHALCLSLDKKTFEKLVKSSGKSGETVFGFVKLEKSVGVRLPSKIEIVSEDEEKEAIAEIKEERNREYLEEVREVQDES